MVAFERVHCPRRCQLATIDPSVPLELRNKISENAAHLQRLWRITNLRNTRKGEKTPQITPQQPGANRLDGFDCELPDGARNELLVPKRARMLGRPVQGRKPRRWLESLLSFVAIIMTLVDVFALLSGIITLSGIGTHSQAPGRDVLLGRTFHPTPAPLSVVQPPAVQAPAPRMPEVRRAELVPITVQRATRWRLPVPRAILWKLPEWRIGERRGMLMPYGLEVVGQLKGRVDDEGLLPVDGNNVGECPASRHHTLDLADHAGLKSTKLG